MQPLIIYMVLVGCYTAIPALCSLDTAGCAVQGGKVYQVDLADGVSSEFQTSASVAAGLINRHSGSPSVFMNLLPADKLWIDSLQNEEASLQNCTWTNITVPALWQLAHDTGAADSIVLYDPDEPWSLANVVIMCGIYKALPMAVTSVTSSKGQIQGDASYDQAEWDTVIVVSGMWNDSYTATEWALDNLFAQCQDTDQLIAVQTPDLMKQGLLADMIVSRQLFAFWLPDMCDSGSPSQALYDRITSTAWQKGHLLTVLGYFSSQEVIATCSKHHTEVTLVSDWSPNLSFLSSMAPVDQLTQPAALPAPAYSASQSYVAIITSDGDNMQMDYNNKRVRMDERQSICATIGTICPPVSWTISNRLTAFAPFVLKWHYRQAARTKGRDSFLMGPSGYGFLHPSIIGASDPVRQDFINLTQAAAAALDMNAYVHWDDYNNALLASTSNLTEYSVDSGEDYSAVELDGHTTRSLAEIADGLGANAVSKEDPNTLAMEAYLRHFDNTDIQTVFSPVMPYVEDWVGNVAVFRELIRWTDPNTEQSVANQLLALPRGTLGYIYQLPEVDMQSVEKLGGLLQGTNVTLVDHRHLRTVALAKIQHEQ